MIALVCVAAFESGAYAQAPDSALRLPRVPDRELGASFTARLQEYRHPLAELFEQRGPPPPPRLPSVLTSRLPTSRDSLPPQQTAYVVEGKLLCPDKGSWRSGTPFAALKVRPEIVQVEIIRLGGNAGLCKGAVTALVIVTTRDQYYRLNSSAIRLRGR